MTIGGIDTHSAMSPTLPNVRDLYLASSVQELRKMADAKTRNIADRNEESYKRMIKTTLDEASKYSEQGNQEMAYVFLYTAANIIIIGSKSKQVDAKFFERLYSSDLKRCLLKLEKLGEDLELRYKRKGLLNPPPTADSPAAEKPTSQAIVNENASQDVRPEKFKTISSKQLYELIKSPETSDLIVIFQTRSQAEYNKCRMDKLPSNVELIQIDPELIKKYPQKSLLTAELDVRSRTSLACFKSAKHVVLLDESSDELTKDSPLEQLYNIFFKLVQDSEKSRAEPVILKGGFSDWSVTYPTYTTRLPFKVEPSVSPSLSQPSSKGPVVSKIEPTPFIPSKPLVNGNASISQATSDGSTVNNKPQVPDSSISYTWNRSTPGGAKQVDDASETLTRKSAAKTMPSIPDRSTKPNLVSPTVADAPANGTGDVGNSVIADAQHKAPPNDDRIGEVSAEINRIILNDSTAKRALSRGSVDSSSFIADKPTINSHSNHLPRTTDRTVSESRSDFAPASPHLVRSSSVPSLNHLNENEPIHGRTLPSFDRSVKPPTTLNDRRSSALDRRDVSIRCGLKNLGNTCYMNSILQCLANCHDLVSYFLCGKYSDHLLRESKSGSSGGALARQLAHLFQFMSANSNKNYNYVSPIDFRKIVGSQMPSFTLGEQHDSHEFFTMLIDKLHADLNQAAKDVNYFKLLNNKRNASANSNNSHEKLQTHIALKKFYEEHTSLNRSIFTEIFEGILLSTLECSVCSSKSDTFEIFTCLSLPIAINGNNKTTLYDCWNAFVADEMLTGDASWDCTVCKVKRDAVKKIKICRLPKVLVIHLKR